MPPHCYYSQVNEVGLVYNGAAVPGNYDFGMGADLFNFVPLANLCDANMERFRLPAAPAAQARCPGVRIPVVTPRPPPVPPAGFTTQSPALDRKNNAARSMLLNVKSV